MDWSLSELKKGESYPKQLHWPSGIDAFIPISEALIKQPAQFPKRDKVILFYKNGNSRESYPLVWIDDKNEQQCSLDIPKWATALKYESYHLEYKKPFTARIPFNYHYIPEKIRFHLISTLIKLRDYSRLVKKTFPVSQLNGGCGILLNLCKVPNDFNSKIPIVILTHDIETEYGFNWIKKISKIEEKYGFRSLWNVIPKRYRINKNILFELLGREHEIGLHGIWHNNKEAFLSKEKMESEFRGLEPFLREFKIKGYRSPAWYRTKNMYKTLLSFFSYDLSCLDVDLVCPAGNGGVGFIRPFKFECGLLEFPCTLPFESPLYWGVSAEKILEYWQPKIDFINMFNGMLLVTTHPDLNYLGNERMIAAYEKLLKSLNNKNWQVMLPRDFLNNINNE